MKVYISFDMEGIAGTFDWEIEKTDRSQVKKYAMQQLQWVIDGIRESKKNHEINEIVIADSHGYGDNIGYEITAYDDRIHLISGAPRPEYMMPAFDERFDIVLLVGYHAGTGTMHGIMDHTYSNKRVYKMWINDIQMNESFINAAYAGYYNVPVGLVIGDEALKNELFQENAMPWVNYVSTKKAIAKFSAINRPVNIVRDETIEMTKKTINSEIHSLPIYKFHGSIKLKIEFHSTSMADVACLMPYTRRIDGRTVEFEDNDYRIIFNAMMALITLSYTVNA